MAEPDFIFLLLAALFLDAVIGDPRWFYRIVPHPTALMGQGIGFLDRRLNRESFTAGTRRALGVLAILLVLAAMGGLGAWLAGLLADLPMGRPLEALLVSTLIAQRSLYGHVREVAAKLSDGTLEEARAAVGHIVGRQTDSLDEHGVARAGLESLAENFSDGVVAPIFWAALLGLPGILAYKALNTADSMIGYRTARHGAFGWAAAQLDDAANYIPARLAGLFLVMASLARGGGGVTQSWRTMRRDAGRHASPNAGYPEAAMAGALGLGLAGPRRYAGRLTEDAWLGAGRTQATADDMRAGLVLYVIACLLVWVSVMALAFI